jgi:hypothetical protein
LLVAGFNVLTFDYEVLAAYTSEPLRNLPTTDMLDHIYRKLGFRVKLDDLSIILNLSMQKANFQTRSPIKRLLG